VLLRQHGLQSFVQGRGRELAGFERGVARLGGLIAAGNGRVPYSYARDADSPTGCNGVAGIVRGDAARRW